MKTGKKMIIAHILVKFVLCIISIEASLKNEENSENKPRCRVGDFGCVDDRSQRDATLTITDYNDQHVVCDNDHPSFCNIVDPFSGIEEKSEKNSKIQFVSRDVYPEIREQNFKQFHVAQNKEMKHEFIQKTDLPQSNSDFVCIEYGFFPGMKVSREHS